MDILQRYAAWCAAGKKRTNSPIDKLETAWGCHRTYPKKLYDKVLATGNTSNLWAGGRPKVFSPKLWDKMIGHIRDARELQERFSSGKLAGMLKKGRRKPAPCSRSIQRKKKELGFVILPIKRKPKLSGKLWDQLVTDQTVWLQHQFVHEIIHKFEFCLLHDKGDPARGKFLALVLMEAWYKTEALVKDQQLEDKQLDIRLFAQLILVPAEKMYNRGHVSAPDKKPNFFSKQLDKTSQRLKLLNGCCPHLGTNAFA